MSCEASEQEVVGEGGGKMEGFDFFIATQKDKHLLLQGEQRVDN